MPTKMKNMKIEPSGEAGVSVPAPAESAIGVELEELWGVVVRFRAPRSMECGEIELSTDDATKKELKEL